MNWYKTAMGQKIGYFKWDDNNGNRWDITYRDIEPSEMYENGNAISNKAIMEKMIVSVQNDAADEKLPDRMIKYWIDKAGMSTDDFFEEVKVAEDLFKDEQRIEQRDIDTGLI